MILHGLLEHLLHRACTSRSEHNTSEGHRQDGVFTDAVVKVFGNVRGKGRRRLMTVEPGGNAQTVVFLLREPLDDLESCLQPSFILESRGLGQYAQGFIHFLNRPSGHPGSQMSGLHHARASTCHHQRALFREFLAQQYDGTVGRSIAQHAMASHHTHHLFRIILVQEVIQPFPDGKVMQGSCQHLHLVFGVLAFIQEVAVHIYVIAAFAMIVLHHLVIECRSGIEGTGRHVKGDFAEIVHEIFLLKEFSTGNHSRSNLICCKININEWKKQIFWISLNKD